MNKENMDPTYLPPPIEDDEIDLVEVAKTIWANRRIIYRTVAVFFVLGLLVAFLSPVEYESETILLPEIQDQQAGGAAGKLLQQFGGLAGISVGDMSTGSISPQLYPQILKSTPFLLHLMDQRVYFSKEDTTVTLYEYFTEIKSPSVISLAMGYTIGLPGKIKKLFTKVEPDFISELRTEGAVKMTEDQKKVAENLVERLNVELDNKIGTVKVIAEMPDPEAAAALNKIATNYLTEFITSYRINKVQLNLDFISERYAEAKENFETAQLALANFRDKNVVVTTSRARTEEERLQTEYNLAFNIYNTLAQQLEQAKIKVQEETPAFSVLEPVKVPLEKSKPRRTMILMFSCLSGLILSIFYILFFNIILFQRFDYQ